MALCFGRLSTNTHTQTHTCPHNMSMARRVGSTVGTAIVSSIRARHCSGTAAICPRAVGTDLGVVRVIGVWLIGMKRVATSVLTPTND